MVDWKFSIRLKGQVEVELELCINLGNDNGVSKRDELIQKAINTYYELISYE